MEIVIVGGGQVGTTLAAKLSSQGHDVTVIERNPQLVAELADTLDIRVVAGNISTDAPPGLFKGIDRTSTE